MFKRKLPVSDAEIERIRILAESLREVSGAVTVNWVAELSDSALETALRSVRSRQRRTAIKRMWEVEEWLSGKL